MHFKRGKYQFRLIHALICIGLLSAALAWLVPIIRHAILQKEVVAKIVSNGGFVEYDRSRWFVNHVNVVDLRGYVSSERIEEVLKDCKQLPGLKTLYLDDSSVEDDALIHVRDLYHIRYLSLAATRITDAGLRQFAGQDGLELVDLRGTMVTDKGIEYLIACPRLRFVSLFETNVSTQGIARLEERGIKNLDGRPDSSFDPVMP